jgi:hypothetical protein
MPTLGMGESVKAPWVGRRTRKGSSFTKRAPEGTELFHLDLQGDENPLWKCFGWDALPRLLPTVVI